MMQELIERKNQQGDDRDVINGFVREMEDIGKKIRPKNTVAEKQSHENIADFERTLEKASAVHRWNSW